MTADGEPTSQDAEPWTVFSAVPNEWPADLVADLARWKQGHIVRDVRVTWMMAPGADDVTYLDNDSPDLAAAEDDTLAIDAAIVVSQTCDIAATGPGAVVPFVLLAPLVPAASLPKGQVSNLAAEGKVGYLFPTLSPDGSSVRWYADLRILVPASKTLLRGREPIEGFASEADSLSFAETLAQRFRRAALSEKLSDLLPQALRKFIMDRGRNQDAFRKVEQVRLLVLDPDRLNPTRGQLFVYFDRALTDDEKSVWLAFEAAAKTLMRNAEITMAPMAFESPRTQPADIYRSTVPIFCDLLGTTRYP